MSAHMVIIYKYLKIRKVSFVLLNGIIRLRTWFYKYRRILKNRNATVFCPLKVKGGSNEGRFGTSVIQDNKTRDLQCKYYNIQISNQRDEHDDYVLWNLMVQRTVFSLLAGIKKTLVGWVPDVLHKAWPIHLHFRRYLVHI